MITDFGDARCAGYDSQQFDFPALQATLNPATQGILEVMIESAVTAESKLLANTFCQIVILGHSDRVDTAGLGSEQRRAQELQISQLRAESAQAWFFNELFTRLQAQGFTPPVDLASMQTVHIEIAACGSADLTHLVPASEGQRKDNRRVHFRGRVVTPDA